MKQARSPLSILLLTALALLAPGEALSRASAACTASVHCPGAAIAPSDLAADAAITAATARGIVEAARPHDSGADRFHEAVLTPSFATGRWSRWARAAARVHHAALPRTTAAPGRSASSPRPPPFVV